MTREPDGQREHLPPWLSNPDYVAPCYCGVPILPNSPYVIGVGHESGLRRAFHPHCYQIMVGGEIEDDE